MDVHAGEPAAKFIRLLVLQLMSGLVVIGDGYDLKDRRQARAVEDSPPEKLGRGLDGQ